MLRGIKPLYCLIAASASAVLAFGLYHVHSFSGVTEGGVLGMTLLLDYWLHLSPAITGFLLNTVCFLFGWRVLGREFVVYSIIASLSFSAAYAVVEQFPPLWPQLYAMPLLAAVAGAAFVGVGAGLSVWAGGASGGDDALAMALSHLTHRPIEQIYLITDLIVLALSLTYIPLTRIAWSLLTVILSGQIVGLMQRIPHPNKKQ
jgi:uncharacterized membrane-anchored protein YitT (DUF2179 family)